MKPNTDQGHQDEFWDGGPAFPVPNYVNDIGETHESTPQGMSLRDYFAAHAPAMPVGVKFASAVLADELAEYAAMTARWARLYADALLKELEK